MKEKSKLHKKYQNAHINHSYTHDLYAHPKACSCHNHNQNERDTGKKIIVSASLFALAVLLSFLTERFSFFSSLPVPFFAFRVLCVSLYLFSYLVIGKSVVLGAVQNIKEGAFFGEEFLMSVASIGAVFLGEYAEACAIMLFFQIGEFFQDVAVTRSRSAISALLDLRPDSANVLKNGNCISVRAKDVRVGDIIEVKPGERVALDGVVLEGESFLDTSAITGEGVPRKIKSGEKVSAGFVNQTGVLKIRVEKNFEESAVSKILQLTKKASENKATSETLVTRFARVYTPIVCFAALFVAFIPPIFFGNFLLWIHRALMFLVVSCPCALVISIPLSFSCAVGASSKCGILVKGSNAIEKLAHLKAIAFDKTGTLTRGNFEVSKIDVFGIEQIELLKIAALAESKSLHPIAKSILNFAKENGIALDSLPQNAKICEVNGRGIRAEVDGEKIAVGNALFMKEEGVLISEDFSFDSETVVFVSKNGELKGFFVISDELKDGVKESVSKLKKLGVKRLSILTGDREKSAQKIAQMAGIEDVRAELLPEDKVVALEQMLGNGNVAFVGDGINDSPSLARADVGISMGALGSDAATLSADVVLMDDDISKIVHGIKISRKTMRIVFENVALTLFAKCAIMILSAAGISGMWLAVFGDVGICVLSILNALRSFPNTFHKVHSV